MLRLPSLLQAVLLAALVAVPCAHGLALQDPSGASHLRQGHHDAIHIINGAVIAGEASVEVQAAFDREASAAAGSPLRKLLHGSHGQRGLRNVPRCNRCAISSCDKRLCTGHCRKHKKLFICHGRLGPSPPPQKKSPPKKKSPAKKTLPPKKEPGSKKATAKTTAKASAEATATST